MPDDTALATLLSPISMSVAAGESARDPSATQTWNETKKPNLNQGQHRWLSKAKKVGSIEVLAAAGGSEEGFAEMPTHNDLA
ncbi:hypothetical protein ACVINW_004020 [Bradyrhizobium sp. USDA 4461]